MTELSLLDKLAINPEGFVFSPPTGESFTANQTGVDVLLALQEQKTPEQIIAQLAKKYDAPKKEIVEDLRDYMDHLRALKIIWRD